MLEVGAPPGVCTVLPSDLSLNAKMKGPISVYVALAFIKLLRFCLLANIRVSVILFCILLGLLRNGLVLRFFTPWTFS